MYFIFGRKITCMELNIFQLHKSEQWLGKLFFSQLQNAMTLSSYITCVYKFLAIFLSITEWMGKHFLKYCYWQESESGAFVFNKHVLVSDYICNTIFK
jgi:hypothetical protein